jgi:hypothetical protein
VDYDIVQRAACALACMDVKRAKVGDDSDEDFIRKRENVWRGHCGGRVLRLDGRSDVQIRSEFVPNLGPAAAFTPSDVTILQAVKELVITVSYSLMNIAHLLINLHHRLGR